MAEPQVAWTAEIMNRFRELVEDPKLHYRDIAATLSSEFDIFITKNACIGKGRRMGLPPRDPNYIRKSVVAAPKRKYIRRVDAPIVPEPPPRQPDDQLTIYQLQFGDCRWPMCEVTAHPPYHYCGKPAIFGQPWCKKHRKLAYSMPRERVG